MDKKLPLPSPCFMDKKGNNQSSLKPYSPSPKICLMPGLVSTGYVQSKLSRNEEFRTPPVPSPEHFMGTQKPLHFSSPQGMLMPRHMQPPPMYGPRGPTVPPKYMHLRKDAQIHARRWCDICDKEFYSKAEFEEHNSEHKICGIDGCTFTGDSSILANHIENTHNSGVYNTIKKLSTPEEIAKWREERRKRYPTRANVELRQKAQEEKIKRGERIGKRNNRFGDKHERRPIRKNKSDQNIVLRRQVDGFKTDNKKKPVQREHERPKASRLVSAPELEREESCKGKLQPFHGTSTLEDYFRPKPKLTGHNPLAGLLSMYNSDSESDYDTENEEPPYQTSESYDKTRLNVSSSTGVGKTEEQNVPNAGNLVNLEISTFESKNISIEPTSPDVSDNELPEEIPIQKIIEPYEEAVKNLEEENLCSTGDGSEIQAKNSNASVTSEANKESKHRKRFKRRGNRKTEEHESEQKKAKTGLLDYAKLRKRRQNTMLEKLLEPDIIHERNVLLQCVRFVVENDFFGIGNKKCI